jgi:RNA-directed DNA polymerase
MAADQIVVVLKLWKHGGAKGLACLISTLFTTRNGMINNFGIKSQPITTLMVWKAYQVVRSNKRSSGIDGMTWQWLEKNSLRELYKLWNRMASGSYFPQAVKEVSISKKDGGTRKLGIPTVLDRIAQQVVRVYLEKKVEPHFHNSSFGYRPKRSCHDAVKQSCSNCFNHDFVIDLDIKSFFDTIDHDMMMKAVRQFCSDKWVILYIERWLKTGIVQENGQQMDRLTGTPQGGVISPLLANIFMHFSFDKWMDKYHPEKPFERYADDVVVHCKTEKQAKFVLRQISDRLSNCKLTLHPVKTKIVNLRGTAEKKYPKSYDFLGFTIRPQWCKVKTRSMLLPSIFISRKSESSILEKFRKLQVHKRRGSIEILAAEMKPILQGIINYYCKFSTGHMRKVCNQLNKRLIKWVQWEKGLYVMASVRWLKKKYRDNPNLFPHWALVHP